MKEAINSNQDLERDAEWIGVMIMLIYLIAYSDPGINMKDFLVYTRIPFGIIAWWAVTKIAKKQGRNQMIGACFAVACPAVALMVYGLLKPINKDKK